MDSIPPEKVDRTVLVTNISLEADQKAVNDFFSFCGKIEVILLDEDRSTGVKRAIITFESETASKTALLLTKAYIQDMAITVSPFKAAKKAEDSSLAKGAGKVYEGAAQLLASTYILSSDSANAAYDAVDKSGVWKTVDKATTVVKETSTVAKERVSEVDNSVKVSETSAQLYKTGAEYAKVGVETLSELGKTVDDSLHIKETARMVVDPIKPVVDESWDWLNTNYNWIKESVSQFREEVYTEAKSQRPDLFLEKKEPEIDVAVGDDTEDGEEGTEDFVFNEGIEGEPVKEEAGIDEAGEENGAQAAEESEIKEEDSSKEEGTTTEASEGDQEKKAEQQGEDDKPDIKKD